MLDHVRNSASVHLEDVEILVLDEADTLLNLGFADEVNALVENTSAERQTMLYTATMTKSVEALAERTLRSPTRVNVDPSLMSRLGYSKSLSVYGQQQSQIARPCC